MRFRELREAFVLFVGVLGCSSAAAPSTTPGVVDVHVTPPATKPIASSTQLPAPPPNVDPSETSNDTDIEDAQKKQEILLNLQKANPTSGPSAQGDLKLALGGSTGGLTSLGASSTGALSAQSQPGRGPEPVWAVTVAGSTRPTIANFGAVLSGMRAGFRRCHHRRLLQDPTAVGSITVDIAIGRNGEVTSTSVASAEKQLGDTVDCVRSRISAAQFAPPAGGKSDGTIRIDFVIAP